MKGRQPAVRPGKSGSPIIPGLGADLPALQKARALWQANRFDESVELFEQTAQRHPQNAVALIDAARALGARFEIARAEPFLERLMLLAKGRPDLLHLVGQTYRMIFRPELAQRCFEQVVARTRDIPDAALELAVLLERRHQVTEAFAQIEDCLRHDPTYAEAQLFRARLLRRLKRGEESLSAFRKMAHDTSLHPAVRAQAWTEVAQELDRREEYRPAMQALLQAKELLRQREGPLLREAESVLQHLVTLTESLTADHYQRWQQEGSELPSARTAVLTSFPRSGTTLLEQILDSHSDVVSSDEREAFARDIFPSLWLGSGLPYPTAAALDSCPPSERLRLRQRYVRFMEAALNEPLAGRLHLDKNPPMTLVLPGFLRLFPEVRILFALRDPRDVVISCFFQSLPLNPNSVCFLTLERTCRRYAEDLRVWRILRERMVSPWLEIRYEDTVADLEREARRALGFLGLPWEESVLGYRERLRTRAVGSPSYEAVSQPLYTKAIGRWKHYQEFLEPWLPILEPSVRAFQY